MMQIYVLFNCISVISGWWEGDKTSLCAMEPHLRFERFPPLAGFESGLARSGGLRQRLI